MEITTSYAGYTNPSHAEAMIIPYNQKRKRQVFFFA